MILALGHVSIFIPFSRLRRVRGSCEAIGSGNADGTRAAEEDEERFLQDVTIFLWLRRTLTPSVILRELCPWQSKVL
jgi:hypothetical protein